MDVVRVIDAEGRLDNRQLHDEFNARRSAKPEIRSRGNGKLLSEIGGIWKTWSTILRGLQIVKARRIEAQSPFAKDPIGAAVKKQHGLKGVADDGDAVFDVSIALRIATWEADGVSQHRQANGPLGRLTKAVQAGVAVKSELLRRFDGNKRDRGDGANVKPADVRLSPHIETAEGRRFPAAESGDEGSRSVQTQNVATLIDWMVVLPIENIADGLDVAAESREAHRIKVAFSPGGINRIVDGVIGDRGGEGARNDSVQRAGAGNAAELQLGEQQPGGVVEGGDVRARQPILQPDAREG